MVTLENSPLSVTADSAGRFALEGLPVGTFGLDVTASPGGMVSGEVGLRLIGLTVASGDGLDLGQIELGALGAIDGTVTLEDSPVTQGAVAVIAGLSESSVQGGAFTFPELLPGTYVVSVFFSDTAGNALGQSASVQVSPGATAQVSIALTNPAGGPTTGAVQGTVLVSGANSNNGVDVQFSGAGPGLTTGGSGTYASGGVPAGLYTVTASLGGFVSVSVPFVPVGAGTTVVPTITLFPTSVVQSDAGSGSQTCAVDSECPAGESCIGGFCGVPVDGGFDAGASDAGSGDAGPADAGAADAGTSDAGLPDAGGGGTCTTAADCVCDGEMACVSSQCAANSLWTQWGPVPPDAPLASQYSVSCADAGSECVVKDSATGLLWQQTVPASPCPSEGTGCVQPDAITYCAGLSYGGYTSGWRLPTVLELSSLVNRGVAAPTIDSTFFPNTPVSTYFWTSSSYVADPADGWYVDFSTGEAVYYRSVSAFFVRCVR